MKRSRPVVCSLVAGLCMSATGQAAPAAGSKSAIVEGELAGRIDEYLSRLAGVGFSGAAAVTQNGEPVLVKGYGIVDPDSRRPVDLQTVFPIGSVTKPFTGSAATLLIERGLISPEDKLGKYFEGVPADKREITVHQLLSHSSGLPGAVGADFDAKWTRDAIIDSAMKADLLFQPGKGYEYSNVGFTLAAIIMEKVTGKSYEQILADELLRPAGMTSTGYVLPKFDRESLAHCLQGAKSWGTMFDQPMLDDGFAWTLRGNGGLHTTAIDMSKWLVALAGDDVFDSAAKKRMWGRYADEGGGQSWYGYGWVNVPHMLGGETYMHNGGDGGGYSADLRIFSGKKTAFFIVSSRSDIPVDPAISENVTRIISGQKVKLPPTTVAVDASKLAGLAGMYTTGAGGTVRVSSAGGAIELAPRGGDAISALIWRRTTSPEAQRKFDDLKNRARKIEDALVASDRAALIAVVGDAERAGDTIREYAEWTRKLGDDFGAAKRAEILGVVPFRSFGIACVVEHVHERGSAFISYVWARDDYIGSTTADNAPSVLAYPAGDGEFITYDALRGGTVPIKFDRATKPTRMTIGASGSALVAERS